ncbi:beta-1,3-galactosyltransferase 2-like [Pyxicephalus adspersus]|uniref:Hexosyltransferase n=1 Tax=Pyxicephalus adspersus TaxID=30357 RepID=A0AAV2ZJY1_PYXAD|nr:TPA: hypothetical protein GDO54_016484 [Pyxicephalus adspersus]
MKKHNYCASCLKLNLKRLLLPVIILGFVTLTYLLFMSLTINNYTWIARKIVIPENYFQYFNSQPNKSQTVKDSYTSQFVLEEQQAGNIGRPNNTLQYKYIITETKKCQKSNPFLILLIAAQAWQTEARQAIRQTWGKEDFLPGVHIVRLFLLGREAKTNNALEQKLVTESQEYHDIIQQDFLDTYNNLTLKTLLGLYWVAKYCPHASYVMKTDSDMFVNTEYLVHTLLKPDQPPRKNFFTGYLMKGYLPNRNKESKWYMSPELYPGEIYPAFCSGTGYVFSGELAEKILTISANIRILHLEDVFVGICLDKLGISPVPPPKDSDFNHWKVTYSHCIYNQLVTSHKFLPSELIMCWKHLQQNKHICI